jgi:tRNA modification GTPase
VQRPVSIRDGAGLTVEKAMVVFHPAPHSYTGEDVSEISCHGNPLIVGRIMGLIRDTGLARLAEKGEFTRRAYLNGKLDLAQAEAVGALVDAGSIPGVDMAKSLLEGSLSEDINSISADIQGILSDIEASFIIDEGDPGPNDIASSIEPIIQEIEGLLEGAEDATRLYSGIITTIAGLPNAGKSSLFNAILGYPRAIVHHEGGTTRDIIREHLVVSGIDFIFHDTAGIRTASSGPEEIGIRNTLEILKNSHLVLYVVDASAGISPEDEQWLSLAEKTLVVMNKADLVEARPGDGAVWVSAKYGQGIDGLFQAMAALFPQDLPRVFLERHAYLLTRARDSLAHCMCSARQGMTPDALAIDLGSALQNLRDITGGNAPFDILEGIFSRFCVGK